ncbi:MAG TPA: sulfate adenylyltransferase subunit CysN [Bosea sp. (in: a-proteobacteria)]|jgi:sulfate adenylyltransferase large subunit|uniref:sulfate adenylyltransferase subunit CysN n=1 Tax=Bosea sp. (in: a-proteobacteria) TaxID=1871050 RepID=UPI002E15F4C0|nr:sulfate adenylyltransferase subunit CysN [Bosea sp. (in: a-proteobacteria)]
MSALNARQRAREATLPGDGPANDDGLQPRSLLRFITCGSVDDGKSTLIGRILFETGAVFDDQLGALQRDSRKFGTQGDKVDFALLVDGLSAEREQGITIDVAYRYFSTPRRSFIVADTPGHEQYTRNMATGASTADLAVILIDARLGLLKQTLRHSFIVSLVGVRHIVVAVNKMDLVDYDRAVFERICSDYRRTVAGLGFAQISFVPISARDGDNVTSASASMGWYQGAPLLDLLETVAIEPASVAHPGAVLPVQWVNRPDSSFRGYSGNLALGQLKVGDAVAVLPSGRTSRIARILTPAGDAGHASAGQALTIALEDEIDISRGDLIVAAAQRPAVRRNLTARLLWTSEAPLVLGNSYALKLASSHAHAVVRTLHHGIDIETLAQAPVATLAMNDIGLVAIDLDRPIGALPFAESTELGGFILIDRISHETVAFGFVAEGVPQQAGAGRLPESRLAALFVKLRGTAGPAGSPRRAALWGLSCGNMAGSLLTGGGIYGLTGSLAIALPLTVADLLLRPFLLGAGWASAHALWRRHQSRNQPAPENVLGDGI